MNEDLCYANHYWLHLVPEVDFNADLEDLVRHAHYRSDQEDGTIGEFYRWVDDRWKIVDGDEIRIIENIIDAENQALLADMAETLMLDGWNFEQQLGDDRELWYCPRCKL